MPDWLHQQTGNYAGSSERTMTMISPLSTRRVMLILAIGVTLAGTGCALPLTKSALSPRLASVQNDTGRTSAELEQAINQSYNTQFTVPRTDAPRSQPTAR
jgi:hypothetical protein